MWLPLASATRPPLAAPARLWQVCPMSPALSLIVETPESCQKCSREDGGCIAYCPLWGKWLCSGCRSLLTADELRVTTAERKLAPGPRRQLREPATLAVTGIHP